MDNTILFLFLFKKIRNKTPNTKSGHRNATSECI